MYGVLILLLSPSPYDNLFLGGLSFPVAGLFGWGNTYGWGLDAGGKVEDERKNHKEVKQVKKETKNGEKIKGRYNPFLFGDHD
jgi:hypothetical protein